MTVLEIDSTKKLQHQTFPIIRLEQYDLCLDKVLVGLKNRALPKTRLFYVVINVSFTNQLGLFFIFFIATLWCCHFSVPSFYSTTIFHTVICSAIISSLPNFLSMTFCDFNNVNV